MACFTVPAAEAIVTTVIAVAVKRKEKKAENSGSASAKTETPSIKMSVKLGWLNMMLWGGSILLMFEHIWHGEVVPWFPFLTAASSAEDTQEMLHEMATVGVTMAVLVTAVWIAMVAVSNAIMKHKPAPEGEQTS
ncbi:MAG: hypothetical protein IKP47_12560 [Ruminococcus sp.]|nr:hypothetical protein [Ruminococcus sp.]